MRRFLILLLSVTLCGCGLAPKNPYPRAKLLKTKVAVSDTQDIREVAHKMVHELSHFPPIRAMAKQHKIMVSIDPLKNTTLYQLDNEKYNETISQTLQASGRFKIAHHTAAQYHLFSQIELINDELNFSLKLENTDTGLLVWQDHINLKITV